MSNYHTIESLNNTQAQQLFELSKQMWWSQNRTMEDIERMLKTSLSFGLTEKHTQNLIGYARVLTDFIKYAFIFDVMINSHYRNKGLSKIIMNSIFAHPDLKKITYFDLTCAPEMIPFYEKFRFSENFGNVRVMRYTRD